jgi:hypothetical protein
MAHWIVNNYSGNDLEWIKEYKPDEVIVYDKKDKNVGMNLLDYFDYIVKNYDNLPDICIFAKGNMLERHITKPELDKIIHNKTLTPLMTANHRTYMPVCYYKDGLFWEVNNQWYVHHHPVKNFNELVTLLGVRGHEYLGFAPGACWLVPRENILKQTKEFYAKLITFIDYDANPAEAHLLERSLHLLWQ